MPTGTKECFRASSGKTVTHLQNGFPFVLKHTLIDMVNIQPRVCLNIQDIFGIGSP